MSDYNYGNACSKKIHTLSAAKGIACFIVAANHYFNLYPIILSVPLLYLKNGSRIVLIWCICFWQYPISYPVSNTIKQKI